MSWIASAGVVGTLARLAWWLARSAGATGWDMRHVVVVASGIVISRGLLAFTYLPLIGQVSPERKYAHNVVMLAIVLGQVDRRRSARCSPRACRRFLKPE